MNNDKANNSYCNFIEEKEIYDFIDFENFHEPDDRDETPFVAYVCTINTNDHEIQNEEIDYLNDARHISSYEKAIRQIPEYHCVCCERILFLESVYHIDQNITVSNITYSQNDMYCNLCCSLIKRKSIPYLSCKQNLLTVDDPPIVLQCLSTVE